MPIWMWIVGGYLLSVLISWGIIRERLKQDIRSGGADLGDMCLFGIMFIPVVNVAYPIVTIIIEFFDNYKTRKDFMVRFFRLQSDEFIGKL